MAVGRGGRSAVTLLLLIAASLPSVVHSASSLSFCKCMCGQNSTIIPLTGTPLDEPPPPSRYHASVAVPVPAPAPALSSFAAAGGAAGAAASYLPDELLPPGTAGFDGSADHGQIYDPADQGYGFPDATNDDAYRRRGSRTQRRQGDGADDYFNDDGPPGRAGELDDGYGSPYSLGGLVPSPTPSPAAEEDEGSAGNSTDTQLVSPKRSGTCGDCNRQFCLDHPDFGKMCGEAKEEEVFTMCFKRDSAKDQLVVYTFIVVTVGLLGYAGVRPWLERKYAALRERRSYAAVPNGQGPG